MSEPHSLEHAPKYSSLPKDILDIVSGKSEAPADALVVYVDQDVNIQRVYSERVFVPTLGSVDFSIDRRQYNERWPSDFDMTDFQYNQGDTFVGSMQFLHRPDGTFELAHRLVVPELRGKKVGEDLLARSEAAFQAVANNDNREVSIVAQFGQRNVINWFLKHGYVLADDHSREDWEDIQMHPEKYTFEKVDDSQEEDKHGREDGIFRMENTGRTIDDTVRINLRKMLKPNTTE